MSIAPSGESPLTLDDLTPYMQREFEKAYEERERPQASRADFLAGFISALLSLSSKSSFKAGRVE
jgi:hypothetical protein